MTPSFFDHFSELPDPRIERCRQHELLDIVFLSVCAVLSGADGWEAECDQQDEGQVLGSTAREPGCRLGTVRPGGLQ